jgi:hypothetical protein
MSRFASLAAIGVLALGVNMAVPATSQAQSFGLHLDHGRTHFDFHRGHDHGRSYAPYHGHGRHRRHSHYHDDYYYRSYRQPIVVPQYHHWTPDRGFHSHGHILVPHRGHYHVRPY